MPRLDGTGPMGMGAGTGRRRGNCNIYNDSVRYNRGYGRGLGLCRWIGSEKEFLERRKEILENELEAIKDRLNKDTGKSEA
ncbi:DUF5320 domain-containing protein [Crassaminicella indica]|uniref:DUF5320 domain-containing protein n=1 Tax=Crassaminicella indica TaxID=2855394 RepID=A0ABX8R8X8_9CLOT|nr:DUF5320 domain-containing protein [Crassaminicella indica]QXM05513.1 DUF5320 domain-containing protein [Crassaminicella indica]